MLNLVLFSGLCFLFVDCLFDFYSIFYVFWVYYNVLYFQEVIEGKRVCFMVMFEQLIDFEEIRVWVNVDFEIQVGEMMR